MRCTATALFVITAATLLIGCGAKTDDVKPPATSVQSESQATATGSSVAGIAVDAGIHQLFAGSSNLAALPAIPAALAICDGAGGLSALVAAQGNQPPQPAAGNTLITKNEYKHPAYMSGSIAYEVDATGLPSAGPNDNWWHVALTFSADTPFTVMDEVGDAAQLSSGTIHLYVHHVLSEVDASGQGSWVHTIDAYTVIPAAAPVSGAIAPMSGVTRDVTISGQRHTRRQILRKINGAQVVSTQVHTVDGDFTGYPVGAGVVSPGSGPALNDATGTVRKFSTWQQTSTISDTAHAYAWNRYASFALQYTFPVSTGWNNTMFWNASLLLTSQTVTVGSTTAITPVPIDNLYITLDGSRTGPLNWAQLVNYYGLNPSYNKASRDF